MNEAPALSITKPAQSVRESLLTDFTWDKIGLIAAVCCLVLLDGVNGALASNLRPYLIGSFAATPDQITWAAIFYFTPKLHMLLLAARFQERFGQRRSLLGVAAVLVLATAGGAVVTNYPSLLAIAFFQGAAGGLMTALGQGALLAAFPRREQALVQCAFLMTWVMFPATIVPAFLGGFAYNYDWQYACWWMALLGLMAGGWLFLKRKLLSDSILPSPVAPVRILLMATSLFAIIYVLEQGNRNAWLEYPPIVAALLLAAACWFGFAFAESGGGPTYLRYHCFKYANFTFGLCISLLAGALIFGSGYLIPGFTTSVLSYPVWQSGLVQLSATTFMTLSLLIVATTLRFTKLPGLVFLLLGLLLFGIVMWHLGEVPSDIHFEGLILWLDLRGFAIGFQFFALTLLTLTAVPVADDVAAAGLFNFGRQLGALAGTAWLQTLLEHLTDRNQTVFGNAVSWANPNLMSYAQDVQRALSLHGAPPWHTPPEAMALMLREAQRQWTSIAFNGCFESLALLLLFAFPLVILARVLTARFLLKPAA